MAKTITGFVLYCNAREETITEEGTGKEVDIETAKELLKKGKILDCNLAFQRLIEFDWNFHLLNEFYDKN